MRTAVKKHCLTKHNCKTTFLEKGKEPTNPKYLNWKELLEDPANVKLVKKPRYWNKPMDLNTGQPLQINSSIASTANPVDSEEVSDESEEEASNSQESVNSTPG